MNPLQRTLIEKAGHDNGFEHVREGGDHEVRLASARHPCTVQIQAAQDQGKGFVGHIQQGMPTLVGELGRMFVQADGSFAMASEAMLARWLRRAASLSQALPNQAVLAYETQVAAELEALAEPTIGQTEIKRMVRQRVGQLLVSEHLTSVQRSALGLTGYMCLRWVAPPHLPYMRFHRSRFLNGVSTQAVMPTP